jgi:hypothetical protein
MKKPIRNLSLTFDWEMFNSLKSEKERYEEKQNARVSWENFVFAVVCGK